MNDIVRIVLPPAETVEITPPAPEPLRVITEAVSEIVVLSAAQQGPPGLPASSVAISKVCADPIPSAGWPLAVDRATGQARIARADTYVLAFVVGASRAAQEVGFVVDIGDGVIQLSDWSAIAGAPQLHPGIPYFLAPAGGITDTPPTTAGHCVVVVGEALDLTRMLFRPGLPLMR